MNKPFAGFLMSDNLEPTPCEECDGTGSSEYGRHLSNLWYGYEPFRPANRGSEPYTPKCAPVRRFAERNCSRSPDYYGDSEAAIEREAQRLCDLFNRQWSHHLNQEDVDALVEAGRLYDLTHKWDAENRQWIPTGYHPTAKEVNDWSIGGMGHDSINQWIVAKAEAKRRGMATYCPICNGEGHIFYDAEHKDAYDNWEPTDPPTGDGWQMWETVSEGSPISPVFSSPEALAEWLGIHHSRDGTNEQWYKMITGNAWAPSGIIMGGKMMSGVEAMAIDD